MKPSPMFSFPPKEHVGAPGSFFGSTTTFGHSGPAPAYSSVFANQHTQPPFGMHNVASTSSSNNISMFCTTPATSSGLASPFATTPFGTPPSTSGAFKSPSGQPTGPTPSGFFEDTTKFPSFFWSTSPSFASSCAVSQTMASSSAPNSSCFSSCGGFGQPVLSNHCGGSRIASYCTTYVRDNHGCAEKFNSISAMDVYSNKSHEELRSEDYQQMNKGPFAANWAGSNHLNLNGPFQNSSVGLAESVPLRTQVPGPGLPKCCSQPGFGDTTNGKSNLFSTNPFSSSSESGKFSWIHYPSSNAAAINPSFFGKQNTSSETKTGAQKKPGFGGFGTDSTQTPFGSGLTGHPFGPGTPFGASFSPAFGPATVGLMAQPFGPVMTLPAFISFVQPAASPAMWSQHPFGLFGSVGSPCVQYDKSPATRELRGPTTSSFGLSGPNGAQPITPASTIGLPNVLAGPACVPSSFSFGGPTTESVGLNGPNGAQTTAPASAFGTPVGLHGFGSTPSFSFASQTTGSLGLSGPNGAQPAAQPKQKENDVEASSSAVPKSPCERDSAKGFSSGGILHCEEADKDEDIISLAEFAVEQHNAMEKGEKLEFVRVVGASLEAVSRGRYRIMLEAKDVAATGGGKLKMFCAVVLRKGTDRPTHLTVLENWLPVEPNPTSSPTSIERALPL